MELAQIFENEAERLEELDSFEILDTPPEKPFDVITSIAAQICGTPISFVSLIDEKRQWFKSKTGLEVSETSRDFSFCAHAINTPEQLMMVSDTTKDHRFFDNPFVESSPFIRFYAGAPLVSNAGYALGTLCVLDTKPNELNENQKTALQDLSNQVVNQLELRKSLASLQKRQQELERKTEELSRFAHLVSHDLKSPLLGMVHLSEMILEECEGQLNSFGEKGLALLKGKAMQAHNLVEGILQNALSDKQANEPLKIQLDSFIEKVVEFCSPPEDVQILIDIQISEVFLDVTILHQVIQNLLSNAIKYNDKEKAVVKITAYAEGETLRLSISDNGPGIPKESQDVIFDMFKKLAATDRFGVPGTGIGLNTVKRILKLIDGTVEIASKMGEGTEFIVRIPNAVI